MAKGAMMAGKRLAEGCGRTSGITRSIAGFNGSLGKRNKTSTVGNCSMPIDVREPKTAEEFDLYYDLRWRILREPWRRGPESARDEREEGAFHLMAVRDGRVVGVGRLHFNSADEAQVRYMAVEGGQQRHGVGSRILENLEQHAQQHGARRVVLNAREAAIPFYRRHGYQLEGAIETSFECVPHWRMTKAV